MRFASSPVDPSREIRVVEILDVIYNTIFPQHSFKGIETHLSTHLGITKTGFAVSEAPEYKLLPLGSPMDLGQVAAYILAWPRVFRKGLLPIIYE